MCLGRIGTSEFMKVVDGAPGQREVQKVRGNELRTLRSDQSGQSLIIVALAMVVILGIAAMTIDVGSWYVKHHQAQVTADAAALAASNCLADAGPGQTCTSTTDTTDAATVATTIAKDNGVTIPASDVSFSGNSVTVTAPNSAPAFFANAFGIHSTTPTGHATAAWTPPSSSSCSTPGNSCAAVFAMGSSCSNTGSQPGGSPIIFSGSGNTITGIVHSNGSIYEAGGGDQTLGPTTYGNGSGCEIDTSNESGDTWNGSSTKPSVGEAPVSTWPDDYSTILTACGGSGQPACTGPCVNHNMGSSSSSTTPAISPDPCTPPAGGTTDNCAQASDGCTGTPAYCTQGAASYLFGNGAASLSTDNVWCAFGTGSPSSPATYTGLIEFQSGSLGSSSTPIYGTWMGGTIDVDHKSYLSTQTSTPTYPVFYSAGSGNCSSSTSGGVCMTASGNEINGAIFAPNGWIEFNGGNTTTDNFLEAQDIYFNGGTNNILGEGPTSVTGGASTPGSDSLTQ
jgi:Flp pilus assembly protein TadG